MSYRLTLEVNGMPLSVPVQAPVFWWRARVSDIRPWVPKDPELDDLPSLKWNDSTQQRWSAIAHAVSAVGHELAAQRWKAGEEGDGDTVTVSIADPQPLTATERHIVCSWFSAEEAIRFDPWSTRILDGRHRLWNTFPYFGNLLVPILSYSLADTKPSHVASTSSTSSQIYRSHLEKLGAIDWFDRHDRLNTHFVKVLAEAAEVPRPDARWGRVSAHENRAEPTQHGASAVGRLAQLVLECDDPRRLAVFWQQILDLPPATGDGEWLTLEWPPVGRLSFHRVADYKPPTWPGAHGEQQLHLDLLVDDLQGACERVEAAGATPVTEVLDPGPKAWRVYADPAGHPFCLVSVPE